MPTYVPLDRIRPNPWQTRHGDPDPEYLASLAADIAANGLLQPPVGRLVEASGDSFLRAAPLPLAAANYPGESVSLALAEHNLFVQLAFGHNRLAAFRKLQSEGAGFAYLPVDLRPLTDQQLASFAWSENERRRDLNPLERALAIRQRLESFGWTQAQAAGKLGISRPAVSNTLRLLELPADLQPNLADGSLSPRQAEALLALFDLPQELRDKGQVNWENATRPSEIVASALQGESSDVTRTRVAQLIARFAERLEKAAWQLDEDLPGEGVTAPACKDCPQRLKGKNLCLEPQCYGLKERLWQARALERASQASGIPALAAGVELYQITRFNWRESKHIPAVRAAACENLRLAFDASVTRHYPERTLADLGHPQAVVVCSKRSGWCTCLKGLEQAERQKGAANAQQLAPEGRPLVEVLGQEDLPPAAEPESAPTVLSQEELAELAREARAAQALGSKLKGAICAAAGDLFAGALGDGNLKAWQKLARELNYSLGSAARSAGAVRLLQASIGEHLAAESLPWGARSARDILRAVNAWLETYDLPALVLEGEAVRPAGPGEAPAADGHFVDLVRRADLARQTIEHLAGQPDPPSHDWLARFCNSLGQLSEEIDALFAGGQLSEAEIADLSPLAEQVSDDYDAVVAIRDLLESDGWSDEGWGLAAALATVPSGDVNFKSALERASLTVLRFVYATVQGRENHGTRAACLQGRIRKMEKETGNG